MCFLLVVFQDAINAMRLITVIAECALRWPHSHRAYLWYDDCVEKRTIKIGDPIRSENLIGWLSCTCKANSIWLSGNDDMAKENFIRIQYMYMLLYSNVAQAKCIL